ncbi:MAG: ASKHA domain-containing protein [Candidatus Brocadiia bacterium]
MTRQTHRVTFQPEGRNVFVLDGTKLVEAAGRAGIILNQPCGGEGTCGKCRVQILQEAPEPTAAGRSLLEQQQLDAGWRLACQLTVHDDLIVSIPEETRFFEQVVLTRGEGRRYPFQPGVRKACVRVPPSSVQDQRSDLDRLQDAIGDGPLTADLDLVRALPGILQKADGEVTAIVEDEVLRGIEPGDTTEALWGVAFDIGTTTIVGSLIPLADASRRSVAAVAARTNPQVHFGDDVVSRIGYVQKHADGLERLHKRLLACLNEMIIELCEAGGAEPESIWEVTAAGNTTMSHIFLGVDPTPIAQAPYVAVVRQALDVRAREVGLQVARGADLYVLPNIAGFVGSDTVAMVLATGMHRDERVRLGIDIGTNGEVVLGNGERLLACSCAAGPAFEGARIRDGMRAADGAISKVVVNEEIEVGVIGGGRPSGICGSGLIDAVAQLLDTGVLDPMGRILTPEEAPADLPEPVRQALVECDDQPAVRLVPASRSKTGSDILLTQRDVREVQLAKAAIQAGIAVLAGEYGIAPEDVEQVLLAGGFGNFVRRSQARRLGLLPAIGNDHIEFVGNAASAGAKTVLLCRDAREEAEQISRNTEYIELANRPDFQQLFADALIFPDGD